MDKVTYINGIEWPECPFKFRKDLLKKYQPERSKREDFVDCTPEQIDLALDKAFHECLDQNSYDILLKVCTFAKMRCSELHGDMERMTEKIIPPM